MKNDNTEKLIQELRKAAIEQKVALWKRVADDLDAPMRQRRAVNIFSIDKNADDGEIVVVPGKVLGEGNLTKKVTVVAFSFSDSALEKINKSGKAMSFAELMASNPKAQKVRILG